MKKRNKFWIYALTFVSVLLIIASACKKDDNEENNDVTPVAADKFTASIDGNSFVATFIFCEHDDGYISILGKVNNISIQLDFSDTLTIGSYNIYESIGWGSCTAKYCDGSLEYYYPTSGTITFSEFMATSGKIKGTFNFIANKQKLKGTTVYITNGTFDVNT